MTNLLPLFIATIDPESRAVSELHDSSGWGRQDWGAEESQTSSFIQVGGVSLYSSEFLLESLSVSFVHSYNRKSSKFLILSRDYLLKVSSDETAMPIATSSIKKAAKTRKALVLSPNEQIEVAVFAPEFGGGCDIVTFFKWQSKPSFVWDLWRLLVWLLTIFPVPRVSLR